MTMRECYEAIGGSYLKANLLKGRDAKPEGAKVRKFDKVSRLPLFPYHIQKRCENGRNFDNFYTIWTCDFKEMQQGHWHILACVLLYAKMAKWVRKLAVINVHSALKKQTVSLKKLQIHGKVILAVLEVMKKQDLTWRELYEKI